MHRRLSRTMAAVAVVCATGLSNGAAGAQAGPKRDWLPTLHAFALAGEVQITNVSCNSEGQSTFSFVATGDVISRDSQVPGTWGTFTETGTAVLGPQIHDSGNLFPDAAWVRIDAQFTIQWSFGDVTGEKHLSDATYNFPSNEAVCAIFPNPTAPLVSTGYAIGGTASGMAYQATMTSEPSAVKPRTCHDKGTSYLSFADANYEVPSMPGTSFSTKQFLETFASASGSIECHKS
jgi:hypothetical protein